MIRYLPKCHHLLFKKVPPYDIYTNAILENLGLPLRPPYPSEIQFSSHLHNTASPSSIPKRPPPPPPPKEFSDSEKAVSREEGLALAKEHGCLFLECAITRENVEQCFEELALKIMEIPSLLEEGSSGVKRNNILKQKPENQPPPSSRRVPSLLEMVALK